MRQQTESRNRGWLPAIRRRLESYGGHVGNRLSVAAGVALVAGMLAALAPRAEAAVPSQMKITFGGYTNRSEVLNNFPVLVVFSNNVGGSSSFNYSNFLSSSGYDLRFGTDATPTTNSLNYEIESWNPNGASYVWVQVPTIPTDGQGAIWANWGNTAASNQLACTTDGTTWTNQYAAVYHLATVGGNRSAADATTRNNGTIVGTVNTITGQIDGGASVTSAGANRIDVANSTSLSIAHKITLSGWINYTQHAEGGAMIIKRNKNDSPAANENYAMWVNGNSSVTWETSGASLTSPNNLVTPGVWTYVAMAVDDSASTKLTMYINGSAVANHTANPSLVAQTSPLNIGNFDAYGNIFQTGGLDELRISPYTHSSNWVWACYQTMASNTVFNNYGAMTIASAITVSPSTLNFGSMVFVGTTNVLTNTVSGVGLTDNITMTVSPSSVYAISTNAVDYFPSLTLTTNASGAVPATNIYVRFIPTSAQNWDGAITNISGSVTQTVTLTATAIDPQPIITVTPVAPDFGNVITNKPSTNIAYTVSGILLQGDVTVTAPSYFKVATNGGTFGATLTLTPSGQTLADTPIHVQFTPSNGAGSYLGTITNTSLNAVTQTVAVTGTGVVQTLYVSATSLNFANVIKDTTSNLTYTVSGSNLEADVTLTVPGSTGFMIKTNGGASFGTSVILPVPNQSLPAGGTLATQTIVVQFLPMAVGGYGPTDITAGSTGATNQLTTLNGTGVMPPVTVSITAPSANQLFNIGDSVTLTATVVPGTPSYWVNIYTNRFSGSYGLASSQSGAGPSFPVSLGSSLAAGTYHAYATVTDSVSSVIYTSAVSAFIVQPAVQSRMLASGGDVIWTYTNYAGTASQTVYGVHQYTNAGVAAFIPNPGLTNVDYLVVGGGGGGGDQGGGGGGGGIVITGTLAVSAQAYSVVVGAGGLVSVNGSTSIFHTVSALGGGAGALPGASYGNGGGGGGCFAANAAARAGGTGTGGGNSGGNGNGPNGGFPGAGGGGGGSAVGANGQAAPLTGQGGYGGTGMVSAITGISTNYGGGGGGGARQNGGVGGAGGPGGGGAGGGSVSPWNGTAGTVSTGGGGGGGGGDQSGHAGSAGSGGSGVVIVRYVIPPPPKGTVIMMR